MVQTKKSNKDMITDDKRKQELHKSEWHGKRNHPSQVRAQQRIHNKPQNRNEVKTPLMLLREAIELNDLGRGFEDYVYATKLKEAEARTPKVKTPLLSPSGYSMDLDELPPGFEKIIYLATTKGRMLYTPQIKWSCPPQFIMNDNWIVATGEESEEAKLQKVREIKVFEAIYDRFSDIPVCPVVSFEVEYERYDDSETPVVPLIPIPEEEEISGLSASMATQASIPRNPPTQAVNQDPIADTDTVASTILTAIKKQAGLINPNLLVRIFSDPNMVEKLINIYQSNPKDETLGSTLPTSQAPTGSSPLPASIKPAVSLSPLPPEKPSSTQPELDTSLVFELKRADSSVPLPGIGSGNVYVLLPKLFTRNIVDPVPDSTVKTSSQAKLSPGQKVQPSFTLSLAEANRDASRTSPVKDGNYSKSLEGKHEKVKEDRDDHYNSRAQKVNEAKRSTPGRPNMNTQKRDCMFFKTLKGCKHGDNCRNRHDLSSKPHKGSEVEGSSGKRMKVGDGGEIRRKPV